MGQPYILLTRSRWAFRSARLSGKAQRKVFSWRLPPVAACAALLHRDTAKNALAKPAGSGKLHGMNSVLEIENALRQMPPEDRWEVARWLLEDLQEQTVSQAGARDSDDNGQAAPPLPDYGARRRRIFGSKVLPNMVLAARAEESW